jgi:hypothetical protein
VAESMPCLEEPVAVCGEKADQPLHTSGDGVHCGLARPLVSDNCQGSSGDSDQDIAIVDLQ